jgi:ectoine hydroxylase-related dioxygenase (phytanoyl-CoA dioxygenase family)
MKWEVIPGVIPMPLIRELREDVAYAWEVCREMQERNGVAKDADMTVHHVLVLRQSFVDLVEAMKPLDELFTAFFQGKYILNSMGGSALTKGHTSYASRIHRDIRTYTSRPEMLNTIVMLDDFTAENGATWICSTPFPDEPHPDYFWSDATQALGMAGSVIVFNSNLWHCAGRNVTDHPRRAITPMYCQPWRKPQFDYPACLGERTDLSEYQRQVIGYNARVPATLAEWYQPPESRFYQRSQG